MHLDYEHVLERLSSQQQIDNCRISDIVSVEGKAEGKTDPQPGKHAPDRPSSKKRIKLEARKAVKQKVRKAGPVSREQTCPKQSSGPLRVVPLLQPGGLNDRLKLAVYCYRFFPEVQSQTVQRHCNIAVKTLMRYVYKSVDERYLPFGLYFGPVRSMYDRIKYLEETMTRQDWRRKCPRRIMSEVLEAVKKDKLAPDGTEDTLNACIKR